VVIMRQTPVCAAVAVLLLFSSGCGSKNFIVKKQGSSFFLTSDRPELKRVLCESGDIDAVARDSRLPDSLQGLLKEKICASRKNKKELKAIFQGMSPDQLADFKDGFRRNGYEINMVADG